jgi:hypothetical protein
MKDKLLPQWMIDLTIVLYRFMCAGFGKKVPKPYFGNFCGPFWAVFFTYLVPILTPFVMLAIVVRLLFGKGRGEAMGNVVVLSGSQVVATKTRASISGALMLGLLAIPIVLFWAIAWMVLAWVGAIALVIVLLVALILLSDAGKLDFFGNFFNDIRNFWDGLPRIVRWPLIGIFLTAFSPVILAFAIVIGLVMGIAFLYENYCPLVRESSLASP